MIETSTQTEQPTATDLYTLSASDFDLKPKSIAPYEEGDRVTRENFVPFVVHGFSLSLGMAESHHTYLRWKQLHEGFNWKDAFREYRSLGGRKVLTRTERELIKDSYSRVKYHAPVKWYTAAEAVDLQLNALLTADYTHDKKLGLSDADLATMTVWELKQRIADARRATLNRR